MKLLRFLAQGLFYALLLTVLGIYFLWYALSVNERKHLNPTPLYAITSPDGQWSFEAYPYGPPKSGFRGVFRIYRSSDRRLEVEFEASDYAIHSSPPPQWITNNEVFYYETDLESVKVPANLWVRLITWLP